MYYENRKYQCQVISEIKLIAIISNTPPQVDPIHNYNNNHTIFNVILIIFGF